MRFKQMFVTGLRLENPPASWQANPRRCLTLLDQDMAQVKNVREAPSPLGALVFFAWVLAVQLTGLAAFTKGFFLTRVELGRQSQCDVSAPLYEVLEGQRRLRASMLHLARLRCILGTGRVVEQKCSICRCEVFALLLLWVACGRRQACRGISSR